MARRHPTYAALQREARDTRSGDSSLGPRTRSEIEYGCALEVHERRANRRALRWVVAILFMLAVGLAGLWWTP